MEQVQQVQQVQPPPTGEAARRVGVAIVLAVLAIAMLARDRILFRETTTGSSISDRSSEWSFGMLSTARVSPEPVERRWFFESDGAAGQTRLWISLAALALVAGGLVLAVTSVWSRSARRRLLVAGILIASAPALWGAFLAWAAAQAGAEFVLSVDWLTPLLAIGALATGVYGARKRVAQRTETTARDQGAARMQGQAPTQESQPDATTSPIIQPGSAEAPRGDGQTSAAGPAPTVPMGVASRVRVTLLVGCILGFLCMLFDVPLYAAPPERRGRGPTDTYSLWSWTGDERRDPMLTPSYSTSLRMLRGEGPQYRYHEVFGAQRIAGYESERMTLEKQQARGRVSGALLALALVVSIVSAVRTARHGSPGLIAALVSAASLVTALLVFHGSSELMVAEFGDNDRILELAWLPTTVLVLSAASILLSLVPLILRGAGGIVGVRVTVERRG